MKAHPALKVTLVANCGIGAHGYGVRVQPIIQESVNRKYQARVFCRNYVKRVRGAKYIKPVPFAKIIEMGIQGVIYFVSSSKFFVRLLEKYRELFDKITAKRLKKGDIFHSWHPYIRSIRRAKKLGMITIMESPVGHAKGLKKMLPHVKDLSSYMPKEELDSYNEVDYVLAASDFVKDTLIAGGVDKKKIIMNPYGFDRKLFYPSKRKKKGKKFTVLFVGMIRKRKDVRLLLEAVKQIGKDNIEVLLCGIIEHKYRKVVNKYRDEINIRTIGFVPYDKLREVYNSADIFVFPSLCESSAKVIYEAMACGLPVITTYNTGSIARDGKDCFIIPIKDVKALKEKILFLYNNPKARTRMGANATMRVKDYTWKHYGRRVTDIYEKVLKK